MTFPTDKLPTEIANAIRGIGQLHNAPDQVSGSVLMAYVCFAAQSLVNVDSHEFGSRPVSDFFMLLLPSGAGKSTIFDEAKKGVTNWIDKVLPTYNNDLEDYDIDRGIWAGQLKGIQSEKDVRQRKLDLKAHMAIEPVPPLNPTQRLFKSGTPVSIINRAKDQHPSMGIFTAEGGEFFGSHAFGKDSGQTKQLITMLTNLWDGDTIEHANSERIVRVNGARLSMCVMAQGVTAEEFLASRLFQEQGIHARMLICQADHWELPKMSADPAEAQRKADIRRDRLNPFHRRIERMLSKAISFHPDEPRRIDPPVLKWTVEAKETVVQWFNVVAHPQNADGPFFRRIYEHAVRLAGALACFEDAIEIQTHHVEAATALVDYYGGQWRAIDTGVVADRHGDERPIADKLAAWMLKRGGTMSRREMAREAPRAFRGLNADKQASILKSMIAWEMIEAIETVGANGHVRDTWRLI